MSILEQFSTPANLPEPTAADRDAWSARVARLIGPAANDFVQFYDPTKEDTPSDAVVSSIIWSAFPASLLREATSQVARWELADSSRDRQDEYCEWSVERDGDEKITRVTFTCEVREFWEHVAERDPDRLLALYHEFVAEDVALDELFADGAYVPANPRNASTEGRLAHLMQGNNNLAAAVDLAAQATILREHNGKPVVTKQALAHCSGLGNPFRNSDPQIAAGVNDAASRGADVTLADPAGLYIDGLITAGIKTPDGTDPMTFWTIERGTEEQALRASYAVPEEAGYKVGDVTVDGRKIRFGAQLADNVCIRLTAIAKPGDHKPARQPCNPS